MKMQPKQSSLKRTSPKMTRRIEARGRLCKMLNSEALSRTSFYNALALKSSLPLHNQAWREQVAQWCYDVVDHLDLNRDIVFVAMNILDRFVATTSQTRMDKSEYERSAITSLFMATRISDSRSLKLTELLHLSESSLLPRDIITTAKIILQSLSWDHQIVTPRSFVIGFLGLLPSYVNRRAAMSWLESAFFLVELAVCDGNFSHVPASDIAYAAILVAMKRSQAFAVDEVTFGRFVTTMLQDTGISFRSAELESLCVRLQNSYFQSQESRNINGPNVVEEEDEEKEFEELPTTSDTVNTSQTTMPRPISPIPDHERR